VPAYPGCPGKEVIKWMSVYHASQDILDKCHMYLPLST